MQVSAFQLEHARSGHTAVQEYHSIYYFAGLNAELKATSSLIQVCTKTDGIHVQETNYYSGVYGHQCVLLHDYLYVFGGTQNGIVFPSTSFAKYHLFAKKWCHYPNHHTLPKHRIYFCMTRVNNDAMVLHGGECVQTHDVFADMHLFQNDKWQIRKHKGRSLARARYAHAYCAQSNALYVHGGMDMNYNCCASLYVYLFEFDEWVPIPLDGAPLYRSQHCMCLVHDCLYLFGGKNENNLYMETMHMLDLRHSNANWCTLELSELIIGRELSSMIFVSQRQCLLLFGGTRVTQVRNDMYEIAIGAMQTELCAIQEHLFKHRTRFADVCTLFVQ